MGIKVGTGAVIAARYILTKDVPPYAIVAGAPAFVKKYRFEQNIIESLLKLKWWDYFYYENLFSHTMLFVQYNKCQPIPAH